MKELIEKLKNGCVLSDKCGGADRGGDINDVETNAIMREAAEHLERFQKIIDALEFINSKL